MNPRHNLIHPSPAFALISVLALVSLAALTATAFLASARLEKTAAMTIGDQTRLTLALDSGYHLASYTFTMGDNTWNWADFLVGEDTDGVGYLYHAVPYAGSTASNVGQWYNYATFSCATLSNIGVTLVDPTNYSATTTRQGGFASDRLNATSRLSKLTNFSTTNVTPSGPVTRIPLLFSRTSPIVNWITNYFTNPTTLLLTPTYRFAYFTEDLSGLIDAERMGGSSSRTSGTNPNEIALGEIGLTNLTTFTNLRPMFLNPGLIESVIRTNGLTNGSVTNPWRYLASGTYSLNSKLSTSINHRQGYLKVPSGLGYPVADTNANAASTNKLNLNKLFIGGVDPSNAISSITAAITNNLPNFTNRAGGMSGTNYLAALAANIIDYADTDGSPTATGSTVGYDNYPLPVVFSDRIALNGANPLTNTANLAAATITVTTYVQLWNCSTLTSPAVTYSLVNNFQDVLLRSNGFSFPSNQIFTNRLTNSLVVPALPPNAVVILAVTNSTTVGPRAGIPGGLAVTTNTLTINHINGNSYTNFADLFELSLGGKIISQHKGSYTRISQKITNGSWDWEGTALLMSRTNNPNLAPIGDPRMLRFQSNPAAIPLAYRSSMSGSLRWGGYPYYEPQGGVWNGHPDNWPDGRKSTAASPTGTGQTGGAGGSLPVAVGTPITLPGTAPAILSTNGKYLTIFELGNVFDPMQWKPPTGFSNNTKYAGCSIDTTWTNTGGELHGGGNTLRIGRPEHPRFAWTNVSGQAQPNMQASAAALLDLFCTDTNTSDVLSGRFDDGDQININTAPPRVLRALAAGIILTNDPALEPSNNYVIPPAAIDAFVKGVTNFRAKYPFYSASQLAFIGTDASWPNTWPTGAVFTTNTMGITAGNDAAVEEWFSKIYALSKVQTRNYRIYVQAQLIKTRGTNTNLSNLTFGAVGRRYYDVLNQQNNPNAGSSPSCSVYLMRKVDY